MSSTIKGSGVDFNHPTKPVQYKKIYEYLNASQGNIVEFAHQLLKHPSWHPDKIRSLRVVIPILLKSLKKLPDQTQFKKLQKIMISTFSKRNIGFQTPDEAMKSLKRLASTEDIIYSENNIANFFGDSFLKNMPSDKNHPFEGNSFESSITFIRNLLKLLDSESLTGKIQQEFAYCEKIANTQVAISLAPQAERKKMRQVLAHDISDDIAGLKEGESLLLPIGWIDLAEGHAMLLKIQRCKNNRFEMLVFNTGEGIQNHEHVVGGSKTYYHPVIRFENLTWEELSDHQFLEALMELKTETRGYKSQDLYKGILSRFSSKQVNTCQLSEKFITPQRSGTCTARVLMNYIKYNTPSVEYQRLHYRMDKKVLEESLKHYKGKLKQAPQMGKLLKMAAERFARRILKLKKGSIHPKTIRNALNRKDSHLPNSQALSNQEIREGLKVVNRLLKEVKGAMSPPKRTHEPFQTLPVNTRYPDVSKDLHKKISEWENKFGGSPKITLGRKLQKPIKFPEPIDIHNSKPSEQIKYLKSLVEASERAIHTGHDDLGCIELTQALLDFPMNSIPQDSKLCKELYHLMTRAANALFSASSISYADRVIAFYRAFAIGIKLAKFNAPDMVSYPISIRPLKLLQSNFNSLSYFSDVQQALDETVHLFEQHNESFQSKTVRFFNFHQWNHKSATKTDSITLPIPSDSAEFYYLNNFSKNIPERAWVQIDAEYEKRFKGVVSNGMTKQEFRVSMLWLGSSKIPASILKGVQHFHSLNQLAIMAELMVGMSKKDLSKIHLPRTQHHCDLSPATFFNLEYHLQTDENDQTKYLEVKLGQRLEGANSLRLSPRKKPALLFQPKLIYTKAYAPEWWPGKNFNSRIPIPSRAGAHKPIAKETWAEMSLYTPFKDLNSAMLENKDDLIFHTNIKHNLSTHLLKDYLINHLDELQKSENQTWFKLSLFHHRSLAENLKDEPILAKQLLEAFDEAIKITKWKIKCLDGGKQTRLEFTGGICHDTELSTLDTHLFLLDMKARLLSHIPNFDSKGSTSSCSSDVGTSNRIASCSNAAKENNRRSHLEQLRSQLREIIDDESSKKGEVHTKSYLHASMILAITYESHPPKNNIEYIELLKGVNLCSYEFRKVSDLHTYITDLHLDDLKHLVYKTVSKNNRSIFEFLNLNSHTLTQLLEELYGVSLTSKAKWENHYPVFIHKDHYNNEYRVNVTTGTITCNGIPLKGYQVVYKDKLYKQAFGNKPFNNAVVSSNQTPVRYTIEDEKGAKIHIYRTSGSIQRSVCNEFSSSSSSDDDSLQTFSSSSSSDDDNLEPFSSSSSSDDDINQTFSSSSSSDDDNLEPFSSSSSSDDDDINQTFSSSSSSEDDNLQPFNSSSSSDDDINQAFSSSSSSDDDNLQPTSSSKSSTFDNHNIHSKLNGLPSGQKEQVVRIEKEIDGRLYVFIPKKDLPLIPGKKRYSEWWPSFPKHPFHENYSTWLSIDNQGATNVKIIDIEKNEVVASISKNGLLNDYSHCFEHVTNTFVDLSNLPIWSSLSHFEEPYYISAKQSLKNASHGHLTVDFTRYRTHNGKMMRFTSKVDNTSNNATTLLQWEQDPQWFISNQQEIMGLPGMKRFLIVDNKEGKRKVILPKLTYSDTASNCSHNRIDCFTMEIDTKGNMLPQTTYEFAYCAYQSLLNKQYEQAMTYLKEAHTLQPYSAEMLRLLGWIMISEDESADCVPDALAVRLYAVWLGKDNLFRTKQSAANNFLNKDPESLYTHYAAPKDWEAYWQNHAYWPYKEAERSGFSAKATFLYERYLSVRKAVSSGLRVDSTLKLSNKRPSLLHVDEEIQFIESLGCSNSSRGGSRQLKARHNHLVEELIDKEISVEANSSLHNDLLPSLEDINQKEIAFIKDDKKSLVGTDYIREVEKMITLRTRHSETIFLKIAPYLYQLALSDDEKDRGFVSDILRDCEHETVTSKKVCHIKIVLGHMLVSPNAAKKIDQIQNWSSWRSDKQKEFMNVLKSIQKENSQSRPLEKTSHHLSVRKNSVELGSQSSESQLSITLSDDLHHHFLDSRDAGRSNYYLKSQNTSEISTIPTAKLTSQYSSKRYEQLFNEYQNTVKSLTDNPIPVLSRNPDQIVQDIEDLFNKTDSDCKQLETAILSIAQKLPAKGSLERVNEKLTLAGRKKEKVTLRDCLLAFIQKNEAGYLKLNSILSKGELQQLHSLIAKYLIQKTNANHYKRILSAKQNPEELAKLLSITRVYSVKQYPELLVFEYFMGYTLRKDQVEDITDFIKKDSKGSYPNIFKQRMMGAGKTEVLGTLLALMKADGHHLSIMVAPRSLYTTNAQDIKRRSNKLFGQKATTINFGRHPKEFTVCYLAYIKRQLIHAVEDRNFVIVPPESLQALENRYFEARDLLSKKYAKLEETRNRKDLERLIKEIELNKLNSDISSLEQPTQLLKSILRLIKERGVITFDEVDAALQVRKELNFPIGAAKPLHPHSCDLVKELFIIAATDPEIKSLGLDLCNNKQHRMKIDDYKKIKPLLTKKVCEFLANDPKWKARLAPIFSILNKGKNSGSLYQVADKLYRFIMDPNNTTLDLDQLHSKKDNEINQAVEMIILLKQQINEWLSLAWKKRADEHYGLSKRPNGPTFAIPYVANNTPNENAQFADPWEMVNRTLQLYISKGLRDDQVQALFKKLKRKAENEWVTFGQPLDEKVLPTVNKVLEATGCNLMELDGSDLTEFSNKVNSQSTDAMRIVLDYVVEEILPTYEQYIEQVTNNSHNLSSVGTALQGYSGTLESIDTLPHEKVNVALDKTAKAKILDTLIKQNNNRVSIVDDTTSFASIMDSVLYDSQGLVADAGKFKALIDIGPLFTGISSEKVAKDIADYFNTTQSVQLKQGVQGVIFWDDKTNDMKFIRRNHPDQVITLPNTDSSTIQSVTGLKKEQLFFYYSHSRITGANAKLQEDAIAVTTFDSQTPIRNWLQGVMRMRQIWQDQRIVTVVPKDLIEVIANKTGQIIHADGLTVQNLVPFADDNESCLQETDILKSVKQKLENAARQYVMNQMLHGKKQEEKALFDTHRALFVRSISKSMYIRFSGKKGEQQKHEFIEFLINKYFSNILSQQEMQHIFSSSSSSACSSNNTLPALTPEKRTLVNEIRTVITSNIENLPDQIDTNISSAWGQESLVVHHQQQTVQQEVNQEQQQEQEQEQEVNIELYSMNGMKCSKRTERKWDTKDALSPNFPVVTPVGQTVGNSGSPVVWSLRDFLQNSEKFNHYAKLFDESVYVTKNFLNTFETVSSFLDRYQKPLYEVVAIYHPHDKKHPWKIMMVSLEEASQFKEFAKDLTPNKAPYFMVLEPNAEIVKSGNFTLIESMEESLMGAILPTLILSGDMRSLNQDKWRPYIESWAKKEAHMKKNLVELNVLQKEGQQKDLYEHSFLKDRLEAYSRDSTPEAKLQFMTMMSMTEQDNELEGLKMLVEFVKNNQLDNYEVFLSCVKVLKAYTSNAIELGLDDKDNHTFKYESETSDRTMFFNHNAQRSYARNLFLKQPKFNAYSVFEKLLDTAIEQGQKKGDFNYALQLTDFAKILCAGRLHRKMQQLVNLLIKNKQFESAKQFIVPEIKIYRSSAFTDALRMNRDTHKALASIGRSSNKTMSEEDHKILKNYYDNFLDYKSYIRIFRWIMALNNAGGNAQARELIEAMKDAHQNFVNSPRNHYTTQERSLPAFFWALIVLKNYEKKKNPNSENLKFLDELCCLKVNFSNDKKRFHEVMKGIQKVKALSMDL